MNANWPPLLDIETDFVPNPRCHSCRCHHCKRKRIGTEYIFDMSEHCSLHYMTGNSITSPARPLKSFKMEDECCMLFHLPLHLEKK